MPTILDLADVPAPGRIEGQSLRGAVMGRQNVDDYAITQIHDDSLIALTTAGWKLIRNNVPGPLSSTI